MNNGAMNGLFPPSSPSPLSRRSTAALAAAAAALVLAGCTAWPTSPPAAPSPPASAPRPAAPPGAVSVTLADLPALVAGRPSPPESDAQRRAWIDELAGHLAEHAATALDADQRLTVHLRSIQRAGATEPWRGPAASQVRIVRDVYPPRIELDFRLSTADGQLLREGRRTLGDAAFMQRGAASPSDPLRHEKALLDDWVRRELGGR